MKQTDIVEQIIDFEMGELAEEELVPFFQQLVDDGILCGLQGSYHRIARHLAEEGLISLERKSCPTLA